MKTCLKCKQTKPFSDYTKDRTEKDGLFYYCKLCVLCLSMDFFYTKRLSNKMRKETRLVLLGVHSDYSIVSEQYGIDKVGLTPLQYRAYMESLWKEGMSWNNYGHGKGKWTIDHIIPKSHFDLTDPEQYKKCSHYTNTQPMWYEENVSKGDRLLLLAS